MDLVEYPGLRRLPLPGVAALSGWTHFIVLNLIQVPLLCAVNDGKLEYLCHHNGSHCVNF